MAKDKKKVVRRRDDGVSFTSKYRYSDTGRFIDRKSCETRVVSHVVHEFYREHGKVMSKLAHE